MNINKLKRKIMNIVSVPAESKGETGYLKLTDEDINQIVKACQDTEKHDLAKKVQALLKKNVERLVDKFGKYPPEERKFVIEGFTLARDYILINKMKVD